MHCMCHSTVCHSPSPHLGPVRQREPSMSMLLVLRTFQLTYNPNKRNLLQRHLDAPKLAPLSPLSPVPFILLRRAAPFSSNHYGRENVTLSTLGAQPALICRAKHDDVKDACHIINTGHCFFSRSISTRLNFRRADVRALSLPVQTTKPNRTQHSPSTSSHDQHELVGASLPTPCASTTKCCTMGAP